MADYGWCYNSTGSKCSGKAQPGTRALRDGVDDIFPILGDLGIYNCRPSSGGGGLSTHGEGRGWDCGCNAYDPIQKKIGDYLAVLLIKNAQALGIQRIIWNRRQWDSRTRTWRSYSGASPHTDHLHIELCWAAARDNPLTVDYVKEVLGGDDVPTQDQWEAFLRRFDTVEDKVDEMWRDHGDKMPDGVYKGVLEDVKQPGGKGLGAELERIKNEIIAAINASG